MYAPRSRTYYTLQDDNDFPLGPPLLLPTEDRQGSGGDLDSDGDDFCSRRAHPRCASQPQSRPSPPTARSVQNASTSNVSASTSALVSDDLPSVPPGLGFDDDLTSAHADLATYCTALNLCESSSWPLDEDLAVIGSSGSLQNSSPSTQDPLMLRFSLSTLSFLGTLGRGGYGKVLLANTDPSTRVAVKVLGKAGLTRDDAEEVKTEVRILRMLAAMDDSCRGGAFAQRMYAAFQTKEHVFVVLDLHCASLSHPAIRSQLRLRPEGGLHPRLRQTFPNSVSLPIAFPSCSSLSTPYDETLNTLRLLSAELLLGILFLHAQGIVHQDVKPANVVVSADGHVVITDFGSARLLPASRYSSRDDDSLDFSCNAARPQTKKTRAAFGSIVLCANDQVSYTERYAAPELLHAPAGMAGRNILVYDQRVDFYSLGLMLRELALGSVGSSNRTQTGAGDRWDCASDGAQRREPLEVDVEFTDFCDQLASRDSDQRLHDSQAMEHPFFEPINELWDDIAALRYPPFTDVVWPEVDEDTRLDLRAYSGDDGDDSFERDNNMDLWLEAVEEIPFDVYQPVLEEPYEPEYLVEKPIIVHVEVAATSQEPVQELCASTTDGAIALPSLSFLPTIPSLDSSSPGSIKKLRAKRASSDFLSLPCQCHPGPAPNSGRKSAPLRRRQVVHDLRLAFQLSSDPSYAPPSRPTRSAARIGRKAGLGMRKATAAKHAQATAAAPLSFEHEITIALLATMGGKNVDAPMATLRCPPSPARVVGCDERRRGKAHSILRALKALVF